MNLNADCNKVKLWRYEESSRLVNSPALEFTFEHSAPVLGARYTPDGAAVITVTADSALHLWDAHSGRDLWTNILDQQPITGYLISRDLHRVVVWAHDRRNVRIWRRRRGPCFVNLVSHRPVTGFKSSDGIEVPTRMGTRLSGDGRLLLSWNADGTVRLWETATGAALEIHGNSSIPRDSRITDTVFSDHNRYAAVLYSSLKESQGGGYLIDLLRRSRVGAALNHEGYIHGAVFNGDGSIVLTWSTDKTARLWTSATGQPLGPPMMHPSAVLRAAFDADSKSVLTYDGDTIRAWSTSNAAPRALPAHVEWKAEDTDQSRVPRHGWVINGTRAARWDDHDVTLTDDAEKHRLIFHAPFNGAAFSSDGTRLLIFKPDTAEVRDSSTGQVLSRVFDPKGQIVGGAFAADDSAAAWGGDGTLRVWYSKTGRERFPPRRQPSEIVEGAVSNDGRRIVTAGESDVRMWDAATGDPVSPPLRNRQRATFTADGNRIIVTGGGLYELRDGRTGQWILPPVVLWKNFDEITEYETVHTGDGTHLVNRTSTTDLIRIWNFVTDYTIPRDKLRLRLEVMTGTRLNSLDDLEVLSRGEWEEAKRRYASTH